MAGRDLSYDVYDGDLQDKNLWISGTAPYAYKIRIVESLYGDEVVYTKGLGDSWPFFAEHLERVQRHSEFVGFKTVPIVVVHLRTMEEARRAEHKLRWWGDRYPIPVHTKRLDYHYLSPASFHLVVIADDPIPLPGHGLQGSAPRLGTAVSFDSILRKRSLDGLARRFDTLTVS